MSDRPNPSDPDAKNGDRSGAPFGVTEADPRGVESLRTAASERASSIDPRAHAAWRTWLAALATDADAVTAAALVYESLEPEQREAWLDALDQDARYVDVPKIALYAPLLGVEEDEARRARIVLHVVGAARRSTPPRALVGTRGGERVCVIITPLYLQFVEVLFCSYDPDVGIRDAWHKWLAHTDDVARSVLELGAPMTDVVLPHLVEELAHAVVADRRSGRSAPPSLVRYIDLFAPDLSPPTREGDEREPSG